MLCWRFLIFYFRAGCLVLKSLNAIRNRFSNAVQWRFAVFFVSLNPLKSGFVSLWICTRRVWFQRFEKKVSSCEVYDQCVKMKMVSLFLSMFILEWVDYFFYRSDTLVSSSCRSIQTWVFARYSKDASYWKI